MVSYALPALIAIGQVRHARGRVGTRGSHSHDGWRGGSTLRVLHRIQPTGGGFLEATPLTSFVVMSLAGGGSADHPVATAGRRVPRPLRRRDGSWPIDTNLATWVTTLSVNALSRSHELRSPGRRPPRIRDWLLGQQYRVEHPYTHAAPGAWAWTDLPGGVPDADDTAGALLALWNLGFRRRAMFSTPPAPALAGCSDLQNRDGGIPTFCRGWGNLPFDRSGCDLTAHALHAWAVWRPLLAPPLVSRVDRASAAGVDYLRKQQRPDGSWVPLWFGNQFSPADENPIYGTARVIPALCAHGLASDELCLKAAEFLIAAQNANGSWGSRERRGDGSIEETSLAVVALSAFGRSVLDKSDRTHPVVDRAIAWLQQTTDSGKTFPPAPIGFYFANLWYHERLYPLIFACAALASAKPSAQTA